MAYLSSRERVGLNGLPFFPLSLSSLLACSALCLISISILRSIETIDRQTNSSTERQLILTGEFVDGQTIGQLTGEFVDGQTVKLVNYLLANSSTDRQLNWSTHWRIRRRTDNWSTHWRIRPRTDNRSTHWRIRRRTDIALIFSSFTSGCLRDVMSYGMRVACFDYYLKYVLLLLWKSIKSNNDSDSIQSMKQRSSLPCPTVVGSTLDGQ